MAVPVILCQIGPRQDPEPGLGPQPTRRRLAVADVEPQEEPAVRPVKSEPPRQQCLRRVELGPIKGTVFLLVCLVP